MGLGKGQLTFLPSVIIPPGCEEIDCLGLRTAAQCRQLYLFPLAADLRNLVSIEPIEKVYSTILVIGKTLVSKLEFSA